MTISTVDLQAEAAAEVRRLTNARALLRDGDERALVQLEGDATWIAMPRRTKLRQSPRRRVYLVWRVAFEDASGRHVESRLVPVAVDVFRLPEKAERREWIRSLLRATDSLVRATVDADCEAWRVAVASVSGAFTSARLRRERDIAKQPSTSGSVASQPGLFDRRAERSRMAHAASVAQSERATVERLQTIAADGTLDLEPARLLLVLVA